MGNKDIAEKMLESYNDVFADIVNGLTFDGEQVIREDELTDATPMGYYKASGQVREQTRDIAKRWTTQNVCIALIGLENQTRPDRYMPVRALLYDAVEYHAQLSEHKAKQDRPQKGHHHPAKRIFPVITLVLYLGYKQPWTGPLTLRELMDSNIPPGLDPLIHDYGINLYRIAWMPLEEIHRRFHSDFRILADYLAQKQLHHDYVPDMQTMRHAREVLQLLTLIERDHRYEDAYDELAGEYPSGEKGQWNMCDVLDKVENRGIEKGIRMERAQNARGMRDIGMTVEQIAAALRIDVPAVTQLLQPTNR